MTLFAKTNYLRDRDAEAPVTQIELFFDLVFVFAVTQLSTELRTHLTPVGLLDSFILFAAVWWVWIFTSWVTNWLDPQARPVRIMLVLLMFLALVLGAALPDAFGHRSLAFAAAYVAMQLGRSLFMVWAVRHHDDSNFRNMTRISTWAACAGIFWLAGGLLPNHRTALWLIALAIDLVSPAAGFLVPGLGRSLTADWEIESHHLAERCAGFILIALGESITVTGETFFELAWTAQDSFAFGAAFCGIVSLWWIYFDRAAARTAEAFARSDDRGRIARGAYTYVHALLVGGIITVASGDFMLLEHPDHMNVAGAAMILGGPALFLAGNGVFRRWLHPKFPPSHVYGILLLAGLAVAAPYISPLILAWAVAAALIIVIIISHLVLRRQEGV
jgi:low temperature requirement protein LtrA